MERWLFLGNPGAGKSTLLNCLLERTAFDAGLSFGSGRTRTIQEEQWINNILVVDSPGIADVTIRPDICAQITAGLKKGGVYKLFFVVMLRNGRAQAEDVATFNEVLRSIALSNIKFSLIINNVEKKQYTLLKESQERYDQLIASFGGGGFLTDSVLLIPTIPDLDEQDNAIIKLPNYVHDFLMYARGCEIPLEAVGTINTDQEAFRARLAQLSSTMQTLLQKEGDIADTVDGDFGSRPAQPTACVASDK